MLEINPIKILSYGVGIVLILTFFVWGMIRLEQHVRWYLQSLWRRDGVDRAAIRKSWKKIEDMGRSSNEYELRQAVVKADSLLDDVLQQKDMHGKNMAQRIKFAMHRYPELRMIWKSHRLRNQLVHEHDVHFKAKTLRNALKDYRKVLRILGVL